MFDRIVKEYTLPEILDRLIAEYQLEAARSISLGIPPSSQLEGDIEFLRSCASKLDGSIHHHPEEIDLEYLMEESCPSCRKVTRTVDTERSVHDRETGPHSWIERQCLECHFKWGVDE